MKKARADVRRRALLGRSRSRSRSCARGLTDGPVSGPDDLLDPVEVGADARVDGRRVLERAELAETRDADDAVRAVGLGEDALERSAAVALGTFGLVL